MKLAYFVHDLTDPAVARRVRMLVAGGADPVVLGFRRSEVAPPTVAGRPAIDLGRTYDARLGQRARMTVRAALSAPRLRARLAGCEVIVARTLEMLAVAAACRLGAPLVYECLDIHRVMLGEGIKSRALRAIERRLMDRASLLVVSSPAFLEHYFRPRQHLRLPAMLLENKVLELEGAPARRAPPLPGPPWRIGWLGAIRCRRSLEILADLAQRRPDLVEVAIHGRPARSEVGDLESRIAGLGNVRFGGAYGPADLSRLYGDVHFSWAIDFMEAGQNSDWLLPNRIYESGRYGAVPIALEGVETGRWLARRGFGVRLEDMAQLENFLEGLTPARYAALRAELDRVPLNAFTADASDCRRLVEGLKKPSQTVGSYGPAPSANNAELAA